MKTQDPKAEIIRLLPRLRRFAYGLVGDSHMADDLVQSGCLKALERWDQFETGTSLVSWLFRIVQNTWLDEYRSRQRRPTEAWVEEMDSIAGEDGRTVLESRSEARRVRELIAELPEDQRSILMLVTVDGMSYQEAASALGLPVGTVMSRLSRARARLAQALGHMEP